MMHNDNATNDEPIISETFKYYKRNKTVKVNLYTDCIKIYHENSNKYELEVDRVYSIADVIGCSLGKGKTPREITSYLTIYTYPKIALNKSQRKREPLILEFNKFDTYEQNLNAIHEWSTKLNKVLSRGQVNNQNNASANSEKPFLIFVNPTSGSGKAKNIFFERVLPIWSEANVPFQLVLTTHQNHAREVVNTASLKDYKGILVVSGDGLVFEVINGIMERADYLEAIKTPIGQIPGGSGNALACCVSYLAKESYSGLSLEKFAMHMTFLTCKYDVLPMDLSVIEIGGSNDCLHTPITPKRIYAFLCTEWAIVADVDYESEKYRYLGGFRFTVGALKRIFDLRTYRGRVSFLPADDCHDYKPKDSKIKFSQNEINTNENSSIQESAINSTLVHKYLKPFHEPVPNDWLILEDNFVFLLVVQLPMIGRDFVAWPQAKLDDGQMLLIYIREGVSKMELLQLFTDTESGNYLTHARVESVRIKAFRLEPLNESGNIMVDGEKIPYGPIQGEVLPKIGNCIAKRIESV